MAKRYRRRGLDRAAGLMVEFLARDGVAGARVLEVGGGVGEIGVELLRRGAESVTNVELSPAYDDEARRLAAEAGVLGRVQRRIVDIAVTPDEVEPADLVVLHRVVCCYPDYAGLLGAAADRCRSKLAFSHPPRNPGTRAFVAMQNVAFALGNKEFRTYAHSPSAMVAVVAARGPKPVLEHRGWIWNVAGFAR